MKGQAGAHEGGPSVKGWCPTPKRLCLLWRGHITRFKPRDLGQGLNLSVNEPAQGIPCWVNELGVVDLAETEGGASSHLSKYFSFRVTGDALHPLMGDTGSGADSYDRVDSLGRN